MCEGPHDVNFVKGYNGQALCKGVYSVACCSVVVAHTCQRHYGTTSYGMRLVHA